MAADTIDTQERLLSQDEITSSKPVDFGFVPNGAHDRWRRTKALLHWMIHILSFFLLALSTVSTTPWLSQTQSRSCTLQYNTWCEFSEREQKLTLTRLKSTSIRLRPGQYGDHVSMDFF